MDEIVVISDTEDNSSANNQCSNERGRVTAINKDLIKIVDINSIIKSKPPPMASTTVSPSTILRPLNPVQGPAVQYKKLLLPTSFLLPNNGLKPHNLQAIQIGGSKNIYLLNIDKRYIQTTSQAAKISTSTSSISVSTLASTSLPIPTLLPASSAIPISTPIPNLVPTSAPISTLVPSTATIPTLLCASSSTPIPTIVPASVHTLTFPPACSPIPSSLIASTDRRTIHYKCLQSIKRRRKIDFEGFTANDRLGFYVTEEKRSQRCLRILNTHIKVRENYLSLLISRRLEYAKKANLLATKVNDAEKVEHFKTTGNVEANRTRRKRSRNVNRLRKRRRGNVKQKRLGDIKLSDNCTNFYNIKMCMSQDDCCQFQWVQLPINYEKLTYSQLMTSKYCSNIYYVDSTNIHDVNNIKTMEPSSNIYFINENNLVTDYYMDSIPFLKDKVKVIDKCVFNKYTNRIEPKLPTTSHDRSAASRKKAFNLFLTTFHNIIKKNRSLER